MKKRLVCLVFALAMLCGCARASTMGGNRVTGFVDRIEDNDIAIVEIVLPDGSFYYVDVAPELLVFPLQEGETIGLYRTGKAYWFSNGTEDKSDDFQVLNIGPDGTYSSWHMVIDHCAWYDDSGIAYVDTVNDNTLVLEIIADDGYVYMVETQSSWFPSGVAEGEKLEVIKYDGSYWYTCGTAMIDDDVEVLGAGDDGAYTSWPGAVTWAPASWFADFLAPRH